MLDQIDEKQKLEAGFHVSAHLVEPQLHRISRGEHIVQVEPRVMQVLVCLAEQPGKTVSKEWFMERVWSDTVVTDDALLRCISELRKIFGDDARKPRFIETIRKRGYRLIAPVSRVHDGSERSRTQDRVKGGAKAPAVRSTTDSSEILRRLWRDLVHLFRQEAYQPRFWGIVAASLVLLASTVASLQRAFAPEPPAPLKTVPFTSFPGEEVDPDLSPRGDQIAFSWDGGGESDFNIYIKQTGTETPLQITGHPADERSPTWSPDGRHIAFVRSTGSGSSIFITPAVGGGERKVKTLDARDVQKLVWSPDGKTLAFSAHNGPYEAFSIFTLSLETLKMRQLTTPPTGYRGDRNPAFSPDGQKLAFVRSVISKIADVFIVSLQEGAPKRLTSDNAEITGLDWMPDGRGIVFTSDRAGMSSLWSVSASGGTPEWVATFRGGNMHQPDIARRGGRMALVQRSYETNIWQLRIDARASDQQESASRPLILSTRWDSNPRISPDGTRIAFASRRSGSYEIWTSDRDGSHPIKLTHFEGHVTDTPRWSPSGGKIAFTSRQEGSADVYVIDAVGGAPRRLTFSASNDKAPNWSRNGRWVYFASNRSGSWQTWKIPADGGEAVRVTRDGGFAALESLDGKHLFYVKRNVPGLWRMPVAGGEETRIIDGLEPYDWGNWILREQGIYFIRRDAGDSSVMLYDLGTGQSQRIAFLEDLPKRPSFTLSPDGAWILHAKLDRSESDILMVNDFK